jgi:hypothetical protein
MSSNTGASKAKGKGKAKVSDPNAEKVSNPALHAMARNSKISVAALAMPKSEEPFISLIPTSSPRQEDEKAAKREKDRLKKLRKEEKKAKKKQSQKLKEREKKEIKERKKREKERSKGESSKSGGSK